MLSWQTRPSLWIQISAFMIAHNLDWTFLKPMVIAWHDKYCTDRCSNRALLNINAIVNVSVSQADHFTTFARCLDTRYAMQRDRYQSRCNVIVEQMHIYKQSICKFDNLWKYVTFLAFIERFVSSPFQKICPQNDSKLQHLIKV